MAEKISKKTYPIKEKPKAAENFEGTAEVNEKIEADKQKKKRPWWRIALDVFIYGVFAIAIAFTIFVTISSKTGNGMIFGNLYPQVLTDSMADKYPVGTVLRVSQVNPEEIELGDAVTFKWIVYGQEMNMTHEIFKIEHDPSKAIGEGYYVFYAHGTNTHSEYCKIGEEYGNCTDTSIASNVQQFSEKELVGKVTGTVPIGWIYDFVKKPIGWIVIILVPFMYVLITCVIDMFKKIPDDEEETKIITSSGNGIVVKRPDGSDPLAGMSEDDKERLKKQMLEELMGNKGGK